MKTFVAVAGLDAGMRARIADAVPAGELRFRDGDGGAVAARAFVEHEAEIVFGNVPADWLAAARRLRWVQLDSAGVDAYLDLNRRRGGLPVVITNLSDFFGQPVAEAALAGLLAFFRRLPALLAAQRDGRWIKPEVEAANSIRQLHGARVIVLGAGAIGRRIAALLAPFEVTLEFFARTAPDATLRTRAQLDAALPAADVVIGTLPHTPDTAGLFDAPRLGRLARHAVLVNVGRGSLLDEAALLVALNENRLAGAVLDVTAVEPLPPGHAFWTHPRVLLTQHTGGRFPDETAAKVRRFLENLAHFRAGEPLRGVLDAGRGY
ncbi:MAG: D-2-hydroxyacid dehydrogenase [Verrucomicrobia bacterium]|nr:D-2-hydroxyacid dehydrogenase [Verrucomicrobiota bacterium]